MYSCTRSSNEDLHRGEVEYSILLKNVRKL